MIYTVQNTAESTRIFYDSRNIEIKLAPGVMRQVDLNDGTLANLLQRNDLLLMPASFARFAPPVAGTPTVEFAKEKPAVSITGHFGIGDNLHQRAVMREMMKSYDVWLHTCHYELYHDLIAQGLKLVMRPTTLHAQARTMAREHSQFEAAQFPAAPVTAKPLKIGYPKALIDQYGSILEAMFGCVGLKMPARPDFSLPIAPHWHRELQGRFLSGWAMGGKPLMVHRPVTVRREWDGRSRNPDPQTYDALFRSIRDQFFVVSIADLGSDREWIDGPQQDADIKLHSGELSFPEMAALFRAADLVFCNAGFAPVLAQAVGTPVAITYGGRESYRTTQRVGAHLASTLPIDPVNPCDCHSANHKCDKHIALEPALARLKTFAVDCGRRDTLLFGTFYVDSPDRDGLTDLWKRLHLTLNGAACDFLAVDSQSPISKFDDWRPYDGTRSRRMYFNFPDNIGHLSRAKITPGRDGWGRAFCKGLEIACELGYDYVGHIEGDSLLRLKVADIVRQMKDEAIDCATPAVCGLRNQALERQWIETGLMFFSTAYLKRSNFIDRYDWPNRKAAPTPERFIKLHILDKDLTDKQLLIAPWKALRADKNQITTANIEKLDLDWVTHQHDSGQQDVYRKFAEAALKEVMPSERDRKGSDGDKAMPQSKLKLNLGCGTNKLKGWENRDADVDITKPLPWADNSASYILIEHCVEHVAYKAAINFFKEALRVLCPGGVLRITVPSLEQIAACDDPTYHGFTMKWQDLGVTKRGAMQAIIYAHGHEMVWNAQLMRDTLYFAGFDDIRHCKSGESDDPVLRGVEGHGKVIGEHFNRIESCTHEARKAGNLAEANKPANYPANKPADTVAIILGGAQCWARDLERAKALIGDRPIRYFLINDQIRTFPEPGVAVTLHPDKLNGHIAWLGARSKAGFPDPEQVWAHRRHAAVTHDTASKDWGGSSGLFAVQVAMREGHRRVIACGVPMTVDGGHYERKTKWQSAIAFRQGWMRCKADLAANFRSLSGWTAEIFGSPDEAWLK